MSRIQNFARPLTKTDREMQKVRGRPSTKLRKLLKLLKLRKVRESPKIVNFAEDFNPGHKCRAPIQN